MIADEDKDGDGVITKEEFMQMLKIWVGLRLRDFMYLQNSIYQDFSQYRIKRFLLDYIRPLLFTPDQRWINMI